LTVVKPEKKSAEGTEELLKANFIKIAKRSKVWLVAMNEAGHLGTKENAAERAF